MMPICQLDKRIVTPPGLDSAAYHQTIQEVWENLGENDFSNLSRSCTTLQVLIWYNHFNHEKTTLGAIEFLGPGVALLGPVVWAVFPRNVQVDHELKYYLAPEKSFNLLMKYYEQEYDIIVDYHDSYSTEYVLKYRKRFNPRHFRRFIRVASHLRDKKDRQISEKKYLSSKHMHVCGDTYPGLSPTDMDNHERVCMSRSNSCKNEH